jgi:hypothetical protein
MGRIAFALGKIVIHKEAQVALERNGQDAYTFVCRHGRGDWGKAARIWDEEINEHGLETAGPIRSAHSLADRTVLLIQTNAERTKTDVYLCQA